MADHPGSKTPPMIPFITDVRVRILANGGSSIRYLDQFGRTLARSLPDADQLEKLGRALIATAFAARGLGEPGDGTDVNLMRHLSITPGGQAATLHAHPPLDRLNAPQDQAVQP